jgi:hypothetical protein
MKQHAILVKIATYLILIGIGYLIFMRIYPAKVEHFGLSDANKAKLRNLATKAVNSSKGQELLGQGLDKCKSKCDEQGQKAGEKIGVDNASSAVLLCKSACDNGAEKIGSI